MIPIAHAGQLDGPTGSVTFPLTTALLDPNVVGSKAAGLAELLRIAGIRVPPAFIITTRAFDLLLASHPGTLSEIAELERLTDPDQIRQCALAIQQAVLAAPIPSMLRGLVVAAYKAFSAELGEEDALVSVRSSADKEDLDGASFAGQYATVLNVRGVRGLLRATRHVWASTFSPDAIFYARANHPGAQPAKMAIIVQQMVQPKVAGTVFSVDLETGAPLISINAVYGLGDSLVGGRNTPDIILVDPISLAIVKRRLGSKTITETYDPARKRTVRSRTAQADAQSFTLSPAEARELARQAIAIATAHPRASPLRGVDLEFAIDERGIFMLQVRPETAWSRINQPAEIVDQKSATHAARLFVAGMTGSPGVVSGRVHVASSLAEAEKTLEPGDILVVAETTHSWERLLSRAGGVITEIGGPGSHSAVVMRELKKPALVGVGRAARLLQTGQRITLDANRRTVWDGALPAMALPAPAKAPEPSLVPSGVTEDKTWEEARVLTQTFVDAAGLRWIGKPAYPVSRFMQEIYRSAHVAAGLRLGIPTGVQIRDGMHMVRFSAVFRWREQACALSLEDLEALNQERLDALSVYLQASAALQPAPVAVRAWIDACVALNMMMGLSYTIYEAVEAMLEREAFENRIPPLILMQARLAQADRMGPSETAMALRDFDRLQARIGGGDQVRAALLAAAPCGCHAPLAGVDRGLVRQLRAFSSRYKVVKADEPDVPLAEVVLALAAQLAAAPPAARAPLGFAPVDPAFEEFFPDAPRLARALRLALVAERARQDAHHLRARGHRLVETRLAGLVSSLRRQGLVDRYADLYAHEPAWLVSQAARYAASG